MSGAMYLTHVKLKIIMRCKQAVEKTEVFELLTNASMQDKVKGST